MPQSSAVTLERPPHFKASSRFAVVLDAVFVAVIVLTFWWGILLIALALRVSSGGPVLFRQRRVGQNGELFTLYKFRTLPLGTLDAPSHLHGVRPTSWVADFVRRSRLDELPQVLNILKGEMTLIGPRPCLPCQTDVIAARSARRVLNVRPGLTGPAQVLGIDMRTPEHLAAREASYIRNRSLLKDLRILLATVGPRWIAP